VNCEQVRHNLDAYVRGETADGGTDSKPFRDRQEAAAPLQSVLTAEIARHLESCAACREEEAIARRVAGALRAMRRAAPAGLAERVLENAPAPRKLGWFTPVRAMAATLLVVAALALTKEGRHFFTDEGFREMTVPAPAAQTKDLAPPPSAPEGGATDGRPSRERQDAAPSRGGAGITDELAEAEPPAPASRAPRSSRGASRRATSERTSAGRVIAPASPEPAPQSGYLKSVPSTPVEASTPAAGAPPPRPAASMMAPAPVTSPASSAEVVATEDESGDEEAAMNELRMLRSDESTTRSYYRTRSAEPGADGAAVSATSDSSACSDSSPLPPAEVTDSTATDSPARR
jgi:hypothetical protein